MRFCKNTYNDDEKSTINATNFTKTILLPNQESIEYSIWDTAG